MQMTATNRGLSQPLHAIHRVNMRALHSWKLVILVLMILETRGHSKLVDSMTPGSMEST